MAHTHGTTRRDASPEEARSRIRKAIQDFVRESPENRLVLIDDAPIYDEPLVAFVDGADPLFARYKQIIGDFHQTPSEALAAAHATAGGSPVTVISWILPFNRNIKNSNRRRELTPSLRWSHSRTYGEQFHDLLRGHVVSILEDMGGVAVAPMSAPTFRWVDLDDGPSSTWSERHAAYAAGLGTFSLSDGFITPVGIAMRCGSVVTNLPLAPSAMARPDHMANCLFYVDGSCKVCIDRCPAGAITTGGHDKNKCQLYQREELSALKERYGAATAGCGLCQTGVPCESRIPVASLPTVTS